MTTATAPSPPTLARGLGFAGLLPFVALALATWLVEPDQRVPVSGALLGYAATIVSFLGAIHWGLMMREAPSIAVFNWIWGVLPSLGAWIALTLNPSVGLLMLAVLLWTCFAVDRFWYARFQLAGWLPMRWKLTVVASASCLIGAAGVVR